MEPVQCLNLKCESTSGLEPEMPVTPSYKQMHLWQRQLLFPFRSVALILTELYYSGKMQVFLHVAVWLIVQADLYTKNVDMSQNSWLTVGTAMLEL